MRDPSSESLPGLAVWIAGLLAAVIAAAVAFAGPAHAGPYHAPRTAFGAPDLQGLWTNTALTFLQRPPIHEDSRHEGDSSLANAMSGARAPERASGAGAEHAEGAH